MRPFGALLPKEEALARLLAAALPITRAEDVPLARAAGRVVAADVRAPFPVPPFARSMMDGYAVRSADTGSRRVMGDAYAGAASVGTLAPGEALRIATGAPVPVGADAVVRVEDADEVAGQVTFRVAPRPGQSIEPAGSDLAGDTLALVAGAHLTPARLGLAASIGLAHLRVRAKPRVAIAATGDELIQPGEPHDALRIYDSNSTTLTALAEASGAEVTRLSALPDELGALERALRDAAAEHDAILISGGASAGEKDLVIDVLRKMGDVLFHGVRVKPGKPLLAARVGACLVIGLPGNPTSALSNACLFVAPALRQMAGLPPASPLAAEAVLDTAVKADPERFLFLPARLEHRRATLNAPADPLGSSLASLTAVPTFKGSGALTSMAASDGWIGVPEGADLPVGSRVVVHAWW